VRLRSIDANRADCNPIVDVAGADNMPKKPETILITQAEFARRVGVIRQRISAMVRQDRLDMVDGKVNLVGRKTLAEIKRFKQKKAPPNPLSGPINPEPEAETDSAIWSKLGDINSVNLQDLKDMSKHDIDKIAKFVTAQRTQQDMRMQRKELYERDLVIRMIYKHFALENSEMKTLGDRLTPEILADCHLDSNTHSTEAANVNKRITEAMLKSLENIKRLLNDFLKYDLDAKPIK
jgi:hypothetical protein